MSEFVLGLVAGWTAGAAGMWLYFRSVRMLRTRKEWYADPVIKARYGDDPRRGD